VQRTERFNSVTSIAGLLLAGVALVALVASGLRAADPWKAASFFLYGATLVLLFAASTLYHSLEGRAKEVFQKVDHLAIYLLIAGTYTPFALVTLRRGWGWWMFAVVWALAAAGILLDLVPKKRPKALAVAICLGMGWLAVAVIPSLVRALPLASVLWLAAGGLLYTVGTPFYALDKRFPNAHGVWHLFVLGGAASHFLSVWLYVG
jgi:hemolysin III